MRAEVFEQRRSGQVETRRFSADGLFQVLDGEVLEDERRFAHRPLAGGRQLAEKPVLMFLMMLDELDGSRERLASRDPDGAVGTPFDDVVMDAADVDDRKGEVTLMVGLFAKDEETLFESLRRERTDCSLSRNSPPEEFD